MIGLDNFSKFDSNMVKFNNLWKIIYNRLTHSNHVKMDKISSEEYWNKGYLFNVLLCFLGIKWRKLIKYFFYHMITEIVPNDGAWDSNVSLQDSEGCR